MQNPFRVIFFPLLIALAGCTSPAIHEGHPSTEAQGELTHGYSLLYDLASQDQDVSKIFFLKSASPPTHKIIDQIATAYGDATTKLEAISKADPTIRMDNHGLPMMEKQTRDAIGSDVEHELLFTSGKTFELQLILCQIKSTEYGAHLAHTIARLEPDEKTADWLNKLGDQLTKLQNALESRLTIGQ